MFGLMSVKKHDRIVAKADAVIDDAAQHLRAEEFSAGRTLGQKVSIAIKRLEEARSNAFRNRQAVITLDSKLADALAEIAALRPDAEKYRERCRRDREHAENARVRKRAARKGAA